MQFTIGGNSYDLTRQQVEEHLRNVEPESGRQHFVEVNGRQFPVKQVLTVALGLSKLDFTTQQARSVVKRLGFTVTER